jgi:urease accessory protein UreF
MRLMPIGQHDAHRLLARRLRQVPEAVEQIEASLYDGGPASFMPAFDIAGMTQQYVSSRLFRS